MKCPLDSKCTEIQDGKEDRCMFFTKMKNQAGDTVDVCAVTLIPAIYRELILLKQSKEKKDGVKRDVDGDSNQR